MDDFLKSFGGAIVLAGVIALVFLLLFATPILAAASVPAVAYIYYRNSPKTKERHARRRTEELYEKARRAIPPNTDEHADRIFDALDETTRDVAVQIYKLEGIDPPPPVPAVCDSVDGARYRDRLIKYINTDHTVTDEFVDALIDCMPRYPKSEGIFRASATLTGREVEDLISGFYGYPDYFKTLKKTLNRNLTHQKDVMPSDYKGDNVTYAYLRDTPLLDLETRHFRIGLKARTEHTQIVAASGSGKTSLLQYLIHHDLEEDCCVIVIDSQRQLIDALANRDIPTEQLAYFSPRHNLGINLFDMPAANEEDVIAVNDLIEYVLSGLLDAKMTALQAALFGNCIQLILATRGGISDLRRLLQKDGLLSFLGAIERLPRAAEDFFINQFNTKTYEERKNELRGRLDIMERNPAFARIFGAPRNPVDMFAEMQNRKLILIDTDVDYLKEGASSFFGRLFIALILNAARQRVSKGKTRRPVYLYIDECAAYLDERVETMIQQVRKANLGLTLIHQDLGQLRKSGIADAILGNTATKFAGRLTDADVRTMASNMRTTPETLTNLPRYHFALSRLGETTVTVSFDTSVYQEADQRYDYDEMVEEMERRYGYHEEVDEPDEEPDQGEPDAPTPAPVSQPVAEAFQPTTSSAHRRRRRKKRKGGQIGTPPAPPVEPATEEVALSPKL